jgi:16S rRNA (guanine527-N7)-methyltransferase
MTATTAPIEQQLADGLAQLGIPAPPDVREKLLAFVRLLDRWNRVFNLTAVRDADRVVSVHILDSLAVLPHVAGPRVLDVGSGGGLPGIPLAIVRSEWSLTLLDSNAKKCAFLRQAAAELRLPNVTVAETRVESFRSAPFDTVVSRAFSEIAPFIEATHHLVAHGGRWVAMKGVRPEAELSRLPATARVIAVESLAVPFLNAERHAVILQPIGEPPR